MQWSSPLHFLFANCLLFFNIFFFMSFFWLYLAQVCGKFHAGHIEKFIQWGNGFIHAGDKLRRIVSRAFLVTTFPNGDLIDLDILDSIYLCLYQLREFVSDEHQDSISWTSTY